MEEFKAVTGIDVIDLIKFITRKNKLHQRLILEELEKIFDNNSEEYKVLRKVILDNTNDLTRSIIREVFGDTFEGYIK